MLKQKNFKQRIWDFIGIPFRFGLFNQHWLKYFHWTSLEQERIREVIKFVRGKLLDIGAGTNSLVGLYKNGIGIETYDWGGGTLVVNDSASLDFAEKSFDTITFVASLNHIPNRSAVLKEAVRVLKDNGLIIITMINPLIGYFVHKLIPDREDIARGGMQSGELNGIWTKQLIKMCTQCNLVLQKHHRFLYGLNNLYVFKKSTW